MLASLTALFGTISSDTRQYLIAGGILVVSFVAGLIVDRIIVGGLRRLAARTVGQFDDVIVASIKGAGRWAGVIVGVFFALRYLPLPSDIDHQIATGTRVAALCLVVVVLARFVSGFAVHYALRLMPSSASLTRLVVNVVVFGIGLLVIFQTLGIQITPIITALGVGGLAVALALQPTLANFFAGIQLLALKEINQGDYIALDTGQEGYVADIGWRSTTLRMLKNNLVVVPNTKMTDAIIVNYTLPSHPFGVVLGVGVSYASDLEKVERVSIEVAREVIQRVEGTVKEFDPVIRFHTFGDSSINYNLIVQCSEFAAQYAAAHELVKALHKRFQEEGIEIPFPIRTVYLKNTAES